MPENSAGRVRTIMEGAQNVGSGQENLPAIRIWSTVFNIEVQTEEGLINKGVVEVTRKLQLLLEEIDLAEEVAGATTVGVENYSSTFTRIRNAIQPFYINNQWQNHHNQYGEHDLTMLAVISNVAGDEEGAVEEASYEEFIEALDDFKSHVAGLEEGALKSFALNQVAHMEQVVSDYRVLGGKAFEQGMKDFAGEAFFNYDVWKENEDSETINKMRGLGGKLRDITFRYLMPTINAVAAMKQLLGL